MSDYQGRVLYDASCSFCTGGVSRFQKLFKRLNLVLTPNDQPGSGFRIVLNNGASYTGPEAYRYLMKRTTWLWPFYALSRVPGLHLLFNATCQWVSDNRNRISQSCKR